MWRCTNGAPNYRRSYWARIVTYTQPSQCSVAVTPFIEWNPWHEGVSSRIEELGQSCASTTIGIEWWRWSISLMVGVSRNDKTQEQIDLRGGR